jgi:hypothetical protein
VLWAADEGILYPEALWAQWRIPLSQVLLARLPSPDEVWRVSLEAVQSGIFQWVVIRPSRSCALGQLRKLQLCAERMRVRVLLLPKHKLPHWVCRASIEVAAVPLSLRHCERSEAIPSR